MLACASWSRSGSRVRTPGRCRPHSGWSPRRRGRVQLTAERGTTAQLGALSYKLWHTDRMAETITFRPDEDAARALAILTQDGTSVSTAVRAALIDAARRRAATRLRSEAEALAADEHDRAEAAQVLHDMETLRAR